jgi:hypothetical protein
MSKPMNIYGDFLVKTTGKHGADISSQRIDDLDIETLSCALHHKDKTGIAVDLGCGIGFQGLRISTLGWKSLLIDRIPIEMTVLKIQGLAELLPISYLQKDARTLTSEDLGDEIGIAYSQRFIHYLQFSEAVSVLALIRSTIRADGKLFLSASGLRSELGEGYPGSHQDLPSRFAPLHPTMAEKHDIHEPVCLYTPDELVALCELASFQPERVFSSSFKNVKGIFTVK